MLACVFVVGIEWAKTKCFVVLALLFLLMIIKIWDLYLKNKKRFVLPWVMVLVITFLIASFVYEANVRYRAEYSEMVVDGSEIELCGRIYRIEEKKDLFRYYLKDCSIMSADHLSCNNVIVYCDSIDFSLGDSIYIYGEVHTFEKASNQGMFDMESFYLSQKIDFSVSLKGVIGYKKDELGIENWVFRMRKMLRKSIEENMSDSYKGVLLSMLLGDKALLDDATKEQYQRTGISHILAISGLHVSLVGMTLYRLFRSIGMGFTLPGILSGVVVLLYSVMTGGMISTIRAVGMFVIIVVGQMLGRKADLLNSLGIMVIVLLYENPFILDYAGFVMSVMAIVGIGVAGRILTLEDINSDNNNEYKKSIKEKLLETIRVSLGIQLVTIPVIAYLYYEIPIYAIIINLLVIPLLGVIFLMGSAGAIMGLFIPKVSQILLLMVGWILRYYDLLCGVVLKLPNAQLITGRPSVYKMCIYYGLLGIILWIIYKGKKEEGNKFSVNSFISKGKMICFMLLFIFITYNKANCFEIDVLNVGQGDGTCILDNSGVSIFIDGGSSDVNEVGKNVIIPFLKSKCIRKVDYWFVSHTDADHYNGLIEVLKSGYGVDHIVLSEDMPKDAELEMIKNWAEYNKTELIYMRSGDRIRSGGTEIKCVSPKLKSEDKNDMSLVLLYRKSGFTGLFTGDISEIAEKKMLQQKLVGQVDFLKVAHHGSKYSSTKEFLDSVSPVVSTVSCGLHNSYGHPGKQAITNIENTGSKIFYTMKQGQIILTSQKGGVRVDPYIKD